MTIVTAITRLAESLGLAVTAEGIEDEIIEARLRSIGTFKGQGYMFGRPAPAAETAAVLTQRGLLAAPRRAAGPSAAAREDEEPVRRSA